MSPALSLAKQINAAIATHGCHMQQDEALIDHIVEHADELRGSAVTAFNAAIEALKGENAKMVAAKDLQIQALTEELAAEKAGHTDAKQVALTTAEERETLRRAHLRTVDDSDAGKEHLADEAEPEEGEDEKPVDADPKASTVAITRKAKSAKKAEAKPAKKR